MGLVNVNETSTKQKAVFETTSNFYNSKIRECYCLSFFKKKCILK